MVTPRKSKGKQSKVAPILKKVETYEGRSVMQTTIEVTNAGDGLSNAMAIEPVKLKHHDTVFVVLECEVDKVRYDPIEDTPDLVRVHRLKAGRATIVDKDLVIGALNEQTDRIQAAVDATVGQQNLDPSVNLKGDHLAGYHHDEPVEGCPDCPTSTNKNKRAGK